MPAIPARLSLPLRLTLACGAASLVNIDTHHYFDNAAVIFAPLMTMICTAVTRGATFHSCWQSMGGLLFGTVLAVPMVMVSYSSLPAMIVCLSLGSCRDRYTRPNPPTYLVPLATYLVPLAGLEAFHSLLVL